MIKHTLHVFGFMGIHCCYLNIPYEEALNRYMIENPEYSKEDAESMYKTLEFTDEFGVYDIWTLK